MAVNINSPAIMAKVRAAVMVGIARGTESIIEEATWLIGNPPKTGNIYRRRGVEHQASAPGEAPAGDLGTLANSAKPELEPAALLGRVRWSTKYARRLEYGGMSASVNKHGTPKRGPVGVYIAARPYARPALAKRRAAILADIQAEIAGALK